MRVPQLNERVKEAPAHALRAVFGGIGSLLSVSDKIRNKPTTAEASASAPTAAPETAAPADMAAPKDTAAQEETAAPADTAAQEVAAAPEDTVAPADMTAPQDTAASADMTATEEAAALPLANYDDLSIASLRARLRNLSADQLTQLVDYEKAHGNRADVISMFERRITKINLGLTQALPKITE